MNRAVDMHANRRAVTIAPFAQKSELPLFRSVMGRFATGVTVITARDGDGVRGMTANAFMSGSLEPPLCVVSVAKRAHMHALLLGSEHFGVSILAEDQERCSVYFAGRSRDGFEPEFDESGPVPLVHGACAHVGATIAAWHDCGDHTLFIGHIFHLAAEDRPPLVYHAGRYAALAPKPGETGDIAPEFFE